jgi:tRNA pseudouridine55 synthase
MHGILLLDKPLGLSSNQALSRAKHLLGIKKAGHTGSLDPLATGMLPCCFGEATKVAGHLLGARKAYEAEIFLGATSSTGDGEGEIAPTGASVEFTRDAISAVLARFVGRIRQRPPMYSALKRNGVPLYKLARRGVAVEVPEREVLIEAIGLLAWQAPRLRVNVLCGAGTYIRSLAIDIGAALGCGAYLSGLRRLWVEPFEGFALCTLQALEHAKAQGADALRACLLPADAGLAALPEVRLDVQETERLYQGQPCRRADLSWQGLCRVYGADGAFAALAERDATGQVWPKRVLARIASPPIQAPKTLSEKGLAG